MKDFADYVNVAWPRLLRSAWMLTGDWHRAEDLVQTVLARAHSRWARIADDAPDTYLQRMMVTTYLSWWRRRWRGETPAGSLAEGPLAEGPLAEKISTDPYASSDLRIAIGNIVAQLPRQQRAVLMLRFHADMTEAMTAETLGISVGTVKSHTAKALSKLRANTLVRAIITESEGFSRESERR